MTEVYAVDPHSLEQAAQALSTAARLSNDARRVAARVTEGSGWAVDGGLPAAMDRFGAVLEVTLGRLVDDAREGAAMLALSAQRYAAAEAAATRTAPRDASAPSRG